MNVLILMIPISFFLSIGFLAIFYWATNDGQFDDLETPSHRIFELDNNNSKGETTNEP